MASKKRHRSRRFGVSAEEHGARARGEVKELRSLHRLLKSNLAAGDCVRSAGLVRSLSKMEGRYLVDRGDSGHAPRGEAEVGARLFTRFVRVCIRPMMSVTPRARLSGMRRK